MELEGRTCIKLATRGPRRLLDTVAAHAFTRTEGEA